jgi:hypothetical protein
MSDTIVRVGSSDVVVRLYDPGALAILGEINAAADAVSDLIEDAEAAAGTATAAAAELFSPWGPKAVSVPAYANAITKKIVLWSAKSRDLYVSLVQTSTTQIRVIVSDPALNDDQVGVFQLASPDYSAGGVNLPDRILFLGQDPLAGVPGGDPDGANYTGLEGYLELHKGAVVEGPAAIQPTGVTETQINPLNIHTTYSVPATVRDNRLWRYRDVIEAGPGRAFATPREAVEALYTPDSLAQLAAAPLGVAVQPESFRATAINPVLIVIDVPDAGSPLEPWQDQNLHLPNYVSMMARYPGAVWFEHSPGATRPILQAHLTHQLIDINWRNTVPEGTDYGTSPTTSSARYAVHRDYFHLFQGPDAEGDFARAALLQIIGGSMVVGPSANIQPFGSAITVQDTVEILDTVLDVENAAYGGSLASANNSSLAFGGGRFTFRNCWDRSGRVDTPTVAVQTKTNAAYPNILNIDGCRGFEKVSLSPGSGGSFVGKWVLIGNNTITAGDVESTIVGDTLGL